MDMHRARELLEGVSRGSVSVDAAVEELKHLPFQDLDFAKIDHHRGLRKGHGEVVYCEGKAREHVVHIARAMIEKKENVLLTRVAPDLAPDLLALAPDAAAHNALARCVTYVFNKPGENAKPILVITGGTSDIPVAEEAAMTAEFMGNRVERLFDVGVAGIHRVLEHRGMLDKAGVLIVVAGMEGALASVVGGMAAAPVIAVPTSVGYGAAFGGLAALLGMLNTCAPGVAVVNIDNGFGAGYFAAVVNALAG